MKYVDEFRDRKKLEVLARDIRAAADTGRTYDIMEVCGTHTMSIFRFGLRAMLPSNIRLISGPGCPVCVTPNSFLDKAVWLAGKRGVIIATFGDMLKVPASRSSLEKERTRGSDIRVVYSTIDALDVARKNPGKEVVFLGVGFETTAPTVAASILIAEKEGIGNYSVLCGHKTMPEILKVLVKDKNLKADAFLLPGHVSTVIGSSPYRFLADPYGKRCVIAGFEPLDIMQAILMIVNQKIPRVDIQYDRAVSESGNALAAGKIRKVFEICPSSWRGIGVVKKSGLRIKGRYAPFDAERKFRIRLSRPVENKKCICADILKGARAPDECPLFGRSCSPAHPVGACMVSGEGTCAAYYKYSYKL